MEASGNNAKPFVHFVVEEIQRSGRKNVRGILFGDRFAVKTLVLSVKLHYM
jgi:hypothetical protein